MHAGPQRITSSFLRQLVSNFSFRKYIKYGEYSVALYKGYEKGFLKTSSAKAKQKTQRGQDLGLTLGLAK